MSADMQPGHGGNAGLCFDDHHCDTPNCPGGGHLMNHPICGLVACDSEPT